MNWLNSLVRSLSAQLIALFTLALLPLGLISISQTRQIVDEANAVAEAALLAKTVAAASEERSLVQNALGAASGLSVAVLNPLQDDTCSDVMRAFVAANPQYTFAGFIPASGLMTCSASGGPVDFSGFPGFDEIIESGNPTVEVNPRGAVTGAPVFIVSNPVKRGGEVLGFVSISIPLVTMNRLVDAGLPEDADFLLATINGRGEVVAASEGIEQAKQFLPNDIPYVELVTRNGANFPAIAGNGDYRHYAITSIIDKDVVLVGSWPAERIGGAVPGIQWRTALLFPILMWLVGIGVAYFGLRRLVVRHIESLRSAMRRFALGERGAQNLKLDSPPGELAEAERAFNRMALIISDAEARREADLRDKEVLLKEVHHRVKNNLQLIASIMNMQARNARSPETKSMLAGLQQRVRGLAMLHRTIYTTPEMTTVDGEELTRTVVNDVTQALDASAVTVNLDLDSVELFPDQAVPLSMLLAEAVTNAVKHIGHDQSQNTAIDVSLKSRTTGEIVVTVTNTRGRPVAGLTAAKDDVSGLGTRLMAAFVAQLEGEAEATETDDRYTYTVTFHQRDFEPVPENAPTA